MRRRMFLAGLAAAAAAAQTKRDGKFLMVHADDAGMCHSVNLATKEALLSGGVQSASIMVPCPWFSEMAETARQNPELDLGLHMTLTSEWKYYRWRSVAPVEQVKGLIDPDGYLWRDEKSVAAHATSAEVEIELKAQIERARKFGIRFTHIDTHMGTVYTRPDFFDVYTKVAKEAGVPCMIPRLADEVSPITAEMVARKEREGFVLLDQLITNVKGSSIEERSESYREVLKNLKPGVTMLIVHLSKDDPEIRAVSGAWQRRWADFNFWNSAEAKTMRKDLGIQTMTFRELAKSR